MANNLKIPKAHLIMALCLPLAVLLGYFVADPLQSGSLAVMVLVIFVLFVPLLMKWYHPMLFLSWNCGIALFFFPGQPNLWMPMVGGALCFAVLNRSVSEEHRFVYVPSLTISLCCLIAVVLVTAMMTGGIGMRTLGSKNYGGRQYVCLLAGALGYFGLTSQRIPPKRAGLYIAFFFLPGLLSLISIFAYRGGPGFYFLYDFFSQEGVGQHDEQSAFTMSIVRYGALIPASVGVVYYLLARHGVRGLFEATKPWRILLVLAAVAGCLLGGSRSAIILLGMTAIGVFCLEGLWRTRWLPILGTVCLVGGVLLLPELEKMPFAVQRALSFLPVKIDPLVQADADGSKEWRISIWKQMLPDVPKRLLKGKGYALDATDLYMSIQNARSDNFEDWAIVASQSHNGPLSVVIPFGIYGVIAFLWFLGAGMRYLYLHYRYGDPALKRINAFLLAAFVAKTIFFMTAFGGLFGDLWAFTGLIGLGVSLNGDTVPAPVPVEEELVVSEAETVEADMAV